MPPDVRPIVGDATVMRRILADLDTVAPTDMPVLFVGESGVGKRALARYTHHRSSRKGGRFTAAECGALPKDLWHSELLGHERGAFTGAHEQRKGLLELSHGGTLFLDTITELPPMLQLQLAYFLEEGTIRRLGGSERIGVSVRVLAAAQSSGYEGGKLGLKPELQLRFFLMEVPPLRERKEDIPELVDIFLRRYAERYAKPVDGLTADAYRLLTEYDYPGNVLELEALIEKAVILSQTDRLSPEDFRIRGAAQAAAEKGMREVVETTEKAMILEALIASDWVQTRAAHAVGISERMLRYKMKKLGIAKPDG